MIGYKVAVSFDNDEFLTPFLAMVTLETLEDSTIIIPNSKSRICTGVPLIGCANDIAHNIPEDIKHKIKGCGELTKYRTDKVIIKNVVSLDPSGHKINNWNSTAYSLYQIAHMLEGYDYHNVTNSVYYKEREQVLSELNHDKDESCGRGIHFFESFEDTILYTLYDVGDYVCFTFRGICNTLRNNKVNQTIIKELIKR